MTDTTTRRYGIYLADGRRLISRAHLTRVMIQEPAIRTQPVTEVFRSGRVVNHPRAAALNASNTPMLLTD